VYVNKSFREIASYYILRKKTYCTSKKSSMYIVILMFLVHKIRTQLEFKMFH